MPFHHNNESSKLDPTVKPFPAYQPTLIAPHSSPTITSYSSSSGIGGHKSKSSNVTSTHHSSSDRGVNAFPHAVLLPPTPVKSFGHGWNSTAPAIPIVRNAQSVSVLDTPPIIIPSRARSPSEPNLPSHTQPQLAPAAPAHKVTSNGGVPFPTFTPRRVPSNYQLNHQPLSHHSSVPSLINDHGDSGRFTPTVGRARDVSQWRQGVTTGLSDHVEEGGSDDEHAYSPNNALLSYRSVPAFTAAPTGPTLSGEYNQSRNIYIPSLPADWREADLERLGKHFGDVMSIRLDVSNGFPPAGSRAFVMFWEVGPAHEFYKHLKRRGCPCEIAKEDYNSVHKSLEDPSSSNLYIQGFLPEDDMDFCREVLYPGRIISYSRPTDAQGRPRGILMARLESRAQAEEAIHRLNDRFVHPVTGNKLQVRIADSEKQKEYKRKSDLNRSDKFSSMPDMRHVPPKILNVNYTNERGFNSSISRETSYASLRSPTSGHFGFQDSGYTTPNRHRPSNLSTSGVGGVWTSRAGWTNGNSGVGIKDVAGIWPQVDESSVHF